MTNQQFQAVNHNVKDNILRHYRKRCNSLQKPLFLYYDLLWYHLFRV